MSKAPRTGVGPERIDEVDNTAGGFGVEAFMVPVIVWVPAGVVGVDTTELLLGGVLAIASELLSWETVSSTWSRAEVTCLNR